jgi:succinate dehydrogenase/fumarate reductase flavoprotein subunit
VGIVASDADGVVRVYGAENVVFAVGGPGGLYQASVYPVVHTGAIGVAMDAGVRCRGLPEFQYGMASIGFRWNVSGTYMQVVPRFVSTDKNGGDECEFLDAYLPDVGERDSLVFLKGYQWPFDARKAIGGSSLIDILVYVETVLRGRRVYLDYRTNPAGYDPAKLSSEAYDYLAASQALLQKPLERLAKMNPRAIELYRDHGIDITREPLEIAVCAQHNNGGLAATCWWESENTAHLFPVGEVNGSHGVYRPGGSALNSGQVGAIRAAERIANRYGEWSFDRGEVAPLLHSAADQLNAWVDIAASATRTWYEDRMELQQRMSRAAAHIRDLAELDTALVDAREQLVRIDREGTRPEGSDGVAEAFCTWQLCVAQVRYLEAVQFALKSGVGSRGSAIARDPNGEAIHPALGDMWRIRGEDESYRDSVLVSEMSGRAPADHSWRPCRPIPDSDTWFETAWASYNAGPIYE